MKRANKICFLCFLFIFTTSKLCFSQLASSDLIAEEIVNTKNVGIKSTGGSIAINDAVKFLVVNANVHGANVSWINGQNKIEIKPINQNIKSEFVVFIESDKELISKNILISNEIAINNTFHNLSSSGERNTQILEKDTNGDILLNISSYDYNAISCLGRVPRKLVENGTKHLDIVYGKHAAYFRSNHGLGDISFSIACDGIAGGFKFKANVKEIKGASFNLRRKTPFPDWTATKIKDLSEKKENIIIDNNKKSIEQKLLLTPEKINSSNEEKIVTPVPKRKRAKPVKSVN